MRNQSVKKNYIFNTVYQVLSLCTPLITAPYLSRTLGADGIGIQSYTNSIVSYFLLVAVLGSTTFGQKKIASDRDNKDILSQSFWEIVFFRFFTVIVTLGVYAVFLFFNIKYRTIYIISAINIVNVFVDITWFYQGIEDFPKVVFRNCIVRVAQIVAIFVFIKSPNDLALYVFLLAGFTVIANIWTWFYIPQYVKKPQHVHIFSNLKDMLLLFLPTIATQVYLVLDKSMIGIITDSTYQNGCYEQSEKIVRMALTIVTSAAAVILPRVANLYNNGEKKQAVEYIYKGYRFVWMLALPIMFGLIAISNIFVPIFFGPGYDLAEILLPIFSVLVLAVSLSYVSGYAFLIPIGMQNIYTIVVCVCALFNFIFNMCLIPHMGATGAAIASVTAESLGAVLQICYCCKKGLLRFGRIFESAWKYIISGMAMLICLQFLKILVEENVVGLCILILAGSIIYFVCLILLRNRFFIDNITSVVKRKKI